MYSSDILRRCIVEQVARLMVLPNKLPIKLSDEIPTVDLRMPEPEVTNLLLFPDIVFCELPDRRRVKLARSTLIVAKSHYK